MSPILDLQRRARELGRIRIGDQVSSNGKSRPNKLTTFRLTSASRGLLEQAAAVHGGDVKDWRSPAGPQFEVYLQSNSIDIIVMPTMALDQHYELWSGGGCERRCDGINEVLSDGPCLCPPDRDVMREMAKVGKACKPTTRLRCVLPWIGDLGMWRLESHGYYAAAELGGTLDLLLAAGARNIAIPAQLRIEARTTKRPGEPTRNYIVPVIELPQVRFEQLRSADVAQIGAPAPRRLASGGQSGDGEALALPEARTVERVDDPQPSSKTRPPARARRSSSPKQVHDAAPAGTTASTSSSPDAPGRSQPAQTSPADGEERATPAQIRKLMVLVQKFGWSDDERRARAGVVSFKALTKQRANRLIDDWEQAADEGRQPGPAPQIDGQMSMQPQEPGSPPLPAPPKGSEADAAPGATPSPAPPDFATLQHARVTLQAKFDERFGDRKIAGGRWRDRALRDLGKTKFDDLTIEEIATLVAQLGGAA